MSSLVERLRMRSEKRPTDDPHAKQIEREDGKEDACQKCGLNENLVSCSTCTYAFHRKCLNPCLNITSDKWSCPECVSPLTEMEKILDCETLNVTSEETTSSGSISKKKPVKRYLIKWKGLSHIHCTWVPEDEYFEAVKIHPRLKTRLNNFNSQLESIDRSDDDYVPIRPEWTTVDRVLTSRKNSTGETEYYVKWKELSYEECTWENESGISVFQPQIERYHEIMSRRKKSTDKSKSAKREMRYVNGTPNFLSGGTLHPYQLEGLKFLRYSWSINKSVILGDEIGKTIQSIAFLASVSEDKFGPHLVVGPLSTLQNWEREFATWAPQMNCLMYFGSSASRDIIKKCEFYYSREKSNKPKRSKSSSSNDETKQSRIKFDVLLTSYEMINMDSAILKTIEWECMIVDEGHWLKNKDSKLFGLLKYYHIQHRVLLMGTPVQYNLDELFMLMHFFEGEIFGSISDLQEEFKDINQDSQVEKLHAMLKPHLLQRLKKDVMEDLPPKRKGKVDDKPSPDAGSGEAIPTSLCVPPPVSVPSRTPGVLPPSSKRLRRMKELKPDCREAPVQEMVSLSTALPSLISSLASDPRKQNIMDLLSVALRLEEKSSVEEAAQLKVTRLESELSSLKKEMASMQERVTYFLKEKQRLEGANAAAQENNVRTSKSLSLAEKKVQELSHELEASRASLDRLCQVLDSSFKMHRPEFRSPGLSSSGGSTAGVIASEYESALLQLKETVAENNRIDPRSFAVELVSKIFGMISFHQGLDEDTLDHPLPAPEADDLDADGADLRVSRWRALVSEYIDRCFQV